MLRQEIEQFLGEKGIAFVGASRNSSKFSNRVYEQLKQSGYDLHPIHPEADSVEGDNCVRSIRELPEDVHALIAVHRFFARLLGRYPK